MINGVFLQEKQEEERLLTLDGFLSYVVDKAKQDVRAVWRGLMSCGFDLHFDRFVRADQFVWN